METNGLSHLHSSRPSGSGDYHSDIEQDVYTATSRASTLPGLLGNVRTSALAPTVLDKIAVPGRGQRHSLLMCQFLLALPLAHLLRMVRQKINKGCLLQALGLRLPNLGGQHYAPPPGKHGRQTFKWVRYDLHYPAGPARGGYNPPPVYCDPSADIAGG